VSTIRKVAAFAFAFFIVGVAGGSAVKADGGGAPAAYATWTAGATAQHGLFTIWHKDGKVYLELTASQLDHDFIQTIVPGSGLGGSFVVWGNTDYLPTELVRFTRVGDDIAILWPNPNFIAPGWPNGEATVSASVPHSIVGMAPIVAEDATSGTVVMDASPFQGDMLDLADILKDNLGTDPGNSYRLDSQMSYLGVTKAFPENIVIEAQQDWTNDDVSVVDAAPDPRNIQMRVVYNIAQPPSDSDHYMPRLADDRIGLYDDVYLDFSNDNVQQRQLRYIVRWNFAPADPTKPVSPATHPLVFTLSDSIPVQYRQAITDAILAWNKPIEKAGVSNAIQVVQQPDDPNWDADDIRYNVIRWLAEPRPSFGADSQTLYDPRTGEEFRTGVLVSGDSGLWPRLDWKYRVDPVRYGRTTDPVPAKFIHDSLFAELLHETGHNMGMQHNFIGSDAYTAKELQDPAFTAKYGVTTTAMEYAPMNLWPRQYGQGDYFQTTNGPYDYHIMQYAYQPIPGAKTPQDEWPTLEKWASQWSNPLYRYGSDEDVSWFNGHASDPRVQQGDLTNDALGWCTVQLDMMDQQLKVLPSIFPEPGQAYQELTTAFGYNVGATGQCSQEAARYVGGQYLSRAHRGDPGADPPVVPTPLADEQRAFGILNKYIFSDKNWNLSPALLDGLTYSEWSGYGYTQIPGYGNLPGWAYSPPQEHYTSIAGLVGGVQQRAIQQMFGPWVLQRLQDNPGLVTGSNKTMSMGDLFAWMRSSVYSDMGNRSISLLRRNLQTIYENTLIGLVKTPEAHTPLDAPAYARVELGWIAASAGSALKQGSLDPATHAHLELLQARAQDALSTK
jgi:hypothetical protein